MRYVFAALYVVAKINLSSMKTNHTYQAMSRVYEVSFILQEFIDALDDIAFS